VLAATIERTIPRAAAARAPAARAAAPGSDAGAAAAETPQDEAVALATVLAQAHARDLADSAALDTERSQFDAELAQRAEFEREFNELRNLQIEQMKRDDEVVKALIRLV
jgi:hypothetical protein